MITIDEFKKKLSNGSRLLGIDLGTKRIGFSISDYNQKIATPLQTLEKSKQVKLIDELVLKMMEIFENTKKEKHLEILNSHPNLAVEKKLTNDSKNEQEGANLNQCTEEEFIEFENLNKEYKKKFGFPFIIAVKGKNKDEILDNFRQRITNDINLEFEEAKKQVKKIANFRLVEIIK